MPRDFDNQLSVTSVFKGIFDRIISAICLVILSPVLLFVSFLIALEDGRPVLFTQHRLGKEGHTFRMYKFRTMKFGSDQSHVLNPDGSLKTFEDDPRITRLGKILRRYSLDELPQLINVLKGEMSLVGPRPDLPFQLEFYTEEERRKLSVKPGMTGLAQISGRNTLPWKERIHLDIEYVDRMSLWFDLKIMVRTMAKVIIKEGIYAESVEPHRRSNAS
ncbi:MAG: sugar transferase [Firmicutes bacterium]|nr:sugar transferase [Bacillota bacterium]